MSSPSVKTSTTLRPSTGFSSHACVDGIVEARRVAELQIAQREDQVVAIVGELAAELDLVAERAHLPLVRRQHAQRNCSAAGFSRSRLAVMLPLKSSITTTENGCTSF